MNRLLPRELAHATELMDQAKFGEALEIIENLEIDESIQPEEKLSALLIKARIYHYTSQYENCVNISEFAYQMSQDLGLASESIEAIIEKANITFIGDLDKASTYVLDAERRLNSLVDDPSIGMLNRNLLHMKAWLMLFKGNFNRAAELAHEALNLTIEQKLGNKLDIAEIYNLLGWINNFQRNQTRALEYAKKSLILNEELNHVVRIARDYSLFARIYRYKGDYDQALKYCKKSFSIKEIDKRTRVTVLMTLTSVYRMKGEINRALNYQLQLVELIEELNIVDVLSRNLITLGYLYRLIGKNDLAIDNFERGLKLSEKWDLISPMAASLADLTLTYIDEKSREKANRYFSRLSEVYNQTKKKGDIDISNWYLLSKAYMMKKSTRMRDRMQAQMLFKELIDQEDVFSNEDVLVFSLGNLCDLLLEELSMHNDPEILDEITPLITKSLEMAELVRNYAWLAETKLLQAKLALIQMKTEEARRLMVEAQHIAELHGLNLLAWGISSEHDKLLEQVDVWDTVKKEEAPMAERIKLASTDGVLERIQGKRAVTPPIMVDEEPILLLIMSKDGVSYFNHSFRKNWDFDDLFSSFMSVFNTFSSEFFSESVDRIKMGENLILINPIESFLVCYVIKGQSYPGLQKLNRFSIALKDNTEIWECLNRALQTGKVLELDDPQSLGSVVNEIFTL